MTYTEMLEILLKDIATPACQKWVPLATLEKAAKKLDDDNKG